MTKTPGAPPPAVELRDVPTLARRTGIGIGLSALISLPFGVLTVLVRTESEWLEGLDKGVADGLNRAVGNQPVVVDLLTLGSVLSAPWVLRGVALVIAVLLWRRRDRVGAVWLGVTLAVGGLLGVVLKLLVERARPEFDEPVAIASGYSFPSGHALNSMLFAVCVLVLVHPRTRGRTRVLAWSLAGLFVALVGLDRIALGVHYVSDVVAGWVVALATVCATASAFDVTHRSRFDTPDPGKPTGMPPRTTDLGTPSAGGPAPEPAAPAPAAPGSAAPGSAAPGSAAPGSAAPGPAAPGPAAPQRLDETEATWPSALGHLAVRLIPGWIAVWAVIVGLGLLVTGPLEGHWPLTVEDDVNQGLESARTSLWNTVTFGLGWLGATAPIVACTIVSAIILRRTLRRWTEAVFVLAAPLGQSVVFFFTQLLIERQRPDVERLDDSPPTSSFPSGHTSAAMALWWALALTCHRVMRPGALRSAVVILFALLPLGVIAARLYRGMHHPSDIAASLVNATLILGLTDRVVRGTTFPAVEGGPDGRRGVENPA